MKTNYQAMRKQYLETHKQVTRILVKSIMEGELDYDFVSQMRWVRHHATSEYEKAMASLIITFMKDNNIPVVRSFNTVCHFDFVSGSNRSWINKAVEEERVDTEIERIRHYMTEYKATVDQAITALWSEIWEQLEEQFRYQDYPVDPDEMRRDLTEWVSYQTEREKEIHTKRPKKNRAAA